MSYDMTGALFKNDDKAKADANPKWADYKGKVQIDGQTYWLSAWLKKDGAGKTYMSLAVKPAGERVGKPVEDSAKTEARFREKVSQAFPADDEIPF